MVCILRTVLLVVYTLATETKWPAYATSIYSEQSSLKDHVNGPGQTSSSTPISGRAYDGRKFSLIPTDTDYGQRPRQVEYSAPISGISSLQQNGNKPSASTSLGQLDAPVRQGDPISDPLFDEFVNTVLENGYTSLMDIDFMNWNYRETFMRDSTNGTFTLSNPVWSKDFKFTINNGTIGWIGIADEYWGDPKPILMLNVSFSIKDIRLDADWGLVYGPITNGAGHFTTTIDNVQARSEIDLYFTDDCKGRTTIQLPKPHDTNTVFTHNSLEGLNAKLTQDVEDIILNTAIVVKELSKGSPLYVNFSNDLALQFDYVLDKNSNSAARRLANALCEKYKSKVPK